MVQGVAEADAFGSLTGAVATKLEADSGEPEIDPLQPMKTHGIKVYQNHCL